MFFSVNITEKGSPRTIESDECEEHQMNDWFMRARKLASERGKTLIITFTPREKSYEVKPYEPHGNPAT